MIGSFANIFKIPELRRKVAITFALCIVYRLGAHVPTPFIDPAGMAEHFKNASGVFAVVDMFSGYAFRQMTVFALGIMPYISASIILQLLQVVWPRLEKIAKEGPAGQKKITQWTRYGTVVLSLFQGFGIGIYLNNNNLTLLPDHWLLMNITTAITMSAGTCFIMWLGEKITEHGIGNGISLLIAVGIIAGYPVAISQGYMQIVAGSLSTLLFLLVFVAMVLCSAFIILTQQASRKVPVQHARRMVGRKMMQGGSTFLPLKLNTAGVIPVIFSSALLSFPQFFFQFLPQDWSQSLNEWTSQTSSKNLYEALGLEIGGVFPLLKVVNVWTIVYVLLTFFFCYFYTALVFNPVDLADNLKKSGAFIPGHKPGKQTSDYLNHILVRITVVGALSLIVVALIPDLFFVGFGIPYGYAQIAGGTGLIIVVGVMLDTMKQVESQLLMRHYEGFSYGGGGTLSRRKARR